MITGLNLSAVLRGRDRASVRELASTMANATFPRYAQDDDPLTAGKALDEFLERLDRSSAFEDLRRDKSLNDSDLAHLVWAIVVTVANKLHQGSLAKPVEAVDRISRNVRREQLEETAVTLRAAELLLRDPIEGISFGDYLRDDAAAASVGRIATLYELALRYRERRANERRLRSPGLVGVSRSPETDLVAAVDEILRARNARERRDYAIALTRDVVDVVLTDEQVRLRLKDLKRRRLKDAKKPRR